MSARKVAMKPKPASKPSTKSAAKKTNRASVKRTLPGDGVYLYSVEEAADRLHVGRTLVYYLVSKGRIESLKIEGLRRITREGLERYVAEQVALTSRLGA
jgi:excisionase family DNA binding protein